MPSRLDDIPVYEYRKGEIAGHYFNHVQIALKRLGEQIRLAIPGLKHLDLILDKEAWIIIDRVHAEVPIAAWSDFEVEHRASLSDPIRCTIRTYHAAADLILERTLDAMEEIIDKQLTELYPEDNKKVVEFKSKTDRKS